MTAEGDDELLAQLRAELLAADPPPDRLRDVAMRAMTWDVEGEALSLLFDSAAQAGGLRSAAPVRDLSYGRTLDAAAGSEDVGPVIEVAVQLGDMAETIVTGMVHGLDVEHAAVVQPGPADTPLAVDAHGRFKVVLTGSVARVVITEASGRVIRTELFSLDP